MTGLIFDQPHAQHIAERKKDLLHTLLPNLISRHALRTAFDLGCGAGYFSRVLKDLGLEVTGVDARAENAAEARRRNPDIPFVQFDIEDPGITRLGTADLVLCFGLLYHLENPFCALRHLSALTSRLCLIESRILPVRSPALMMINEHHGRDQALRSVAHLPSNEWLISGLYHAGFSLISTPRDLPDHTDFRSSFLLKQRRTVLLASKTSTPESGFTPLPFVPRSARWTWHRLPQGVLSTIASLAVRTRKHFAGKRR